MPDQPEGRAPTLLVSFHGGKKENEETLDNVYSFTGFGTPRPILQTGGREQLSELRKFLFDPTGEYLYVANAYKNQSQLLRFKRTDEPKETFLLEDVWAEAKLAHPFDVIFGPGGALLVSNQDSASIVKVTAKGSEEPFAGGFKFKEIRGLAYDGTYVYVADAGLHAVIGFDATGKSTTTGCKVRQPVHLLYEPTYGWLFIGSEAEDAVYVWRPAQPKTPPLKLVSATQPAIDHTAGMALQLEPQERATLYVASRLAKQVLAFELDSYSAARTPRWNGQTGVALDGLKDYPEFVGIPRGLYG